MKWTEDVHLDRAHAADLAVRLCDEWALEQPSIIVFEAGCCEDGYVFWPESGIAPRLMFRGNGTTLESLAHELAHLVEGPDESTHGVDHHFLTRLVAYQLLEYLRDA